MQLLSFKKYAELICYENQVLAICIYVYKFYFLYFYSRFDSYEHKCIASSSAYFRNAT